MMIIIVAFGSVIWLKMQASDSVKSGPIHPSCRLLCHQRGQEVHGQILPSYGIVPAGAVTWLSTSLFPCPTDWGCSGEYPFINFRRYDYLIYILYIYICVCVPYKSKVHLVT